MAYDLLIKNGRVVDGCEIAVRGAVPRLYAGICPRLCDPTAGSGLKRKSRRDTGGIFARQNPRDQSARKTW